MQMKKYSLYLLAVVAMASCNVKVSTNDDTKGMEETTQEGTSTTAAAKIKDPVCGMEMDGEHWTEMAVTGTDTTWFCSPHCKEQYTKDPGKYQQPEPPKS
jgi:YHS domain-containing protein